MSPGLVAGLLLLAPADPPREWTPAHRDAVARYGAALLQARRDRLITAAAGFEKDLEICATIDAFPVVPLYQDRQITALGPRLEK